MKVLLKRRLFIGGVRYRNGGEYPVEIPDKYRKFLPKDAVVVGEQNVPAEDAPENVPAEDAPETVPAQNVVGQQDEMFYYETSDHVEEPPNEVDAFRNDLKNMPKVKSKGKNKK